MTRTDNKLARAGYRVLRLSAQLVEQDPEVALRLIRATL
jgi:very-short-patch-repair endonuclease